MADELITAGSNLSAIVPEVWSSRFYEVLKADLVFRSLLSTDYQGDISDLGDRVNVAQFPEFDEGDELAEDARQDASAITVTSQQLVINKRVVKDFIVTKKATLQSLPHMDKLRELAVYAILKKIERTIIETIVPNSANAIGYNSGTTLALADILAAKELLDAANVGAGDRSMVIGSAAINDLFNITGFMSSDFVSAGSPLSSGQAPSSLLGFVPQFTTLVGTVSFFMHKSFMTIASQEGMTVEEFNLGAEGVRAARLNLGTLYGLKQLDGVRVVSIT